MASESCIHITIIIIDAELELGQTMLMPEITILFWLFAINSFGIITDTM